VDIWPRFWLVPQKSTSPIPTIDLTVHVRTQLSDVKWELGDWLLARFTTRRASGGFMEEDGEVWTADGQLVAHSRQLALGQ